MFNILSENIFQLLQPKLLLAELVTLVSLAFAIRLFVHATREASLAERQCCKPAKNRALIWDPFLGVDFIIESMQNARKSRYIKGSYERYQRFGSTYMMKSMFYQMIHTTDPENVKEVLATSFDKFKLTWIRVNAMEPLFGHGIFTSDGDRWSDARALLRPAFTRQNMTPMLDMMERHFQLLLALLPKDDSTVDLQELLSSFSMDTATEFLLGHSVNSLNPEKKTKEDHQFYLDYIKCCLEAVRMIQLGPLQPFAFNLGAQRAKSRAFRYVNRFVDEVLELKRSGKLESEDTQACGLAKYCFLRELAKNTDDRDMLRDQVLSVLLAGKDTTAGLMSNLFFELARHPDVYTKLRQEVINHLSGCPPNTEDLKSMQYLRFVINEALRLYPSVPSNTREAICDTTLPVGGGPDGKSPLFVKKGTSIFFNSFSMHRREDIYGPEPEQFRPERWEGLRPGWGYLPFNGGPRTCLGQQYALTEVSYVVIRMIQTFIAIESRDNRPWVEFYTLSICSKNGVLVGLKRSV